jgi:hypothetical protein
MPARYSGPLPGGADPLGERVEARKAGVTVAEAGDWYLRLLAGNAPHDDERAAIRAQADRGVSRTSLYSQEGRPAGGERKGLPRPVGKCGGLETRVRKFSRTFERSPVR